MSPDIEKFIESNYLSVQEDEGFAALFLKPDPRIKSDKFLQLTPFLPTDHLEKWIQDNTARIINILQNKQADEITRQFSKLFPQGSLTTELYRPVTYYRFSTIDLERFYDTNFGEGEFKKLSTQDQQELKSLVQEEVLGVDVGSILQAGMRIVSEGRQASVQFPDDFITVNTHDLIKEMGFKAWLDLGVDERQVLPKVISNLMEASIPIHRIMLSAFKKFHIKGE